MTERPWLKRNYWWMLLIFGLGLATFTDHMGWSDWSQEDYCCRCPEEEGADA